MFLIAKGFDNGFLFWLFWVELQCMGRDILSKDYGEQGYWLFITNFLIVEFDLTDYKNYWVCKHSLERQDICAYRISYVK